ncbi:hypothetical protein B0H19DRAFT_1077325 [Mycena capillaripes]|nr:hypothetical protein B0H19DRAFT_1077324 [Mycena capillaripes]KAJ6541482.1 hypothetical protein B0H19DRAFT_1077325 [Mycena capillaripes]
MAMPWLFFVVFLLYGTFHVKAFTFHSTEGFALVRKTLLAALPTFEPHSYQLDGISKVLDKTDLVAVTPTGSGKTGFLFLTIIVMIAILRIRQYVPAHHFPKIPSLWLHAPQILWGISLKHIFFWIHQRTRTQDATGAGCRNKVLSPKRPPSLFDFGNCRILTVGSGCATEIRP